MFRPDTEIKQILLDIAGLTAYLGLGITLWQITTSIPYIVAYTLLILCLLLLLRYHILHQTLDQLQGQLNNDRHHMEKLQQVQGLFEGMLGLWFYTTELPTADIKHHFTFLEEEYIIHGGNGTYNWILEGRNTLDEYSQSLTLKFSGDAPTDTSALALSVVDDLTGQRYHDKQIKIAKDLPYLKTFEVIFPEPIAKEEQFKLRLSCRWDNTFPRSRRYDYVFFPLGYYAAKGIDKLLVRLVCDVPLNDFILSRLDSGRLVKEHTQPRILSRGSKHFVLEWEVSQPQHVFVLQFTKDVDNSTAPN